jgi:hypothetical protein
MNGFLRWWNPDFERRDVFEVAKAAWVAARPTNTPLRATAVALLEGDEAALLPLVDQLIEQERFDRALAAREKQAREALREVVLAYEPLTSRMPGPPLVSKPSVVARRAPEETAPDSSGTAEPDEAFFRWWCPEFEADSAWEVARAAWRAARPTDTPLQALAVAVLENDDEAVVSLIDSLVAQGRLAQALAWRRERFQEALREVVDAYLNLSQPAQGKTALAAALRCARQLLNEG